MAAAATESPTATKLEALTSNVPAKDDEEVDVPSTDPIECIVCLDTLPRTSRANLRCSHDVCKDCFGKYASITIEGCNGFPRCPQHKCEVVATDELIAQCVAPEVAGRMRKLRGLYPARAKDGRRMWCVAEGCCEPLAPPLIDVPNNNNNNNANGNGNDSANPNGSPNANANGNPNPYGNGNTFGILGNPFYPDENIIAPNNNNNNGNNDSPAPDLPPPTSTCGKCGTEACLVCGARAHAGTPCVAPTVNLRQQRLYAEYCLNRIAPCSQCGTHVERNGGCSQMLCGVCGHSFTFRPFTTVRQVQESIAFSAGTVPPPRPNNRRAQMFANMMPARHAGHAEGEMLVEQLDRLGRMARRNGMVARNLRRRADLNRFRGPAFDPPPARAMPGTPLRYRPFRTAPVVPPPPPPAMPLRPVGYGQGHRPGPAVGRRFTPPPTYDYISDEEMDYYDHEFDILGHDDPFGMPRNRPLRLRGPGAAAAMNRVFEDTRAALPMGHPMRYDVGAEAELYRTRRRADNLRTAQRRRIEAAEARRIDRARRYTYDNTFDNGGGDLDGWLEFEPPYQPAPPAPLTVGRIPRGEDTYGTAPRRRASTGTAGVGRVDNAMRNAAPELRPVPRRRTLSDLEGPTMSPAPIRRRTSADGAGAPRTSGPMANGRNVRFAPVERAERATALAEETRTRRRDAMRRAMAARTFRTHGPNGMPEPEDM